MQSRDLVHSAAARCAASAEVGFALLADVTRIGEWALGCWGATAVGEDVARGRSLFDGAETFVRVLPDASRLSVDYEVGGDRQRLVRRISARAIPGDVAGLEGEGCLVVLLAWRHATMDDDRWQQLVAAHGVEILLLRRCVEAEVAKR